MSISRWMDKKAVVHIHFSVLIPGLWCSMKQRSIKVIKTHFSKLDNFSVIFRTCVKQADFWLQSLLLFSHSVMSDSLWPHGLQHSRLPCPSQSPAVYSNSCPLLVMPSNNLILCCPLLLLTSVFSSIRVFPVSQLFISGGQSTRVSASVLAMNIQSWFPLGLTGLILQSKGPSIIFSNTIVQKNKFFRAQLSL